MNSKIESVDTDRPKIIGVNKRHFPTQAGTVRSLHIDISLGCIGGWSRMPPCTTVVLVAGDIGDYACYVGHGDDDWVAMNGDKLSFAEARCHFPWIEEACYRS